MNIAVPPIDIKVGLIVKKEELMKLFPQLLELIIFTEDNIARDTLKEFLPKAREKIQEIKNTGFWHDWITRDIKHYFDYKEEIKSINFYYKRFEVAINKEGRNECFNNILRAKKIKRFASSIPKKQIKIYYMMKFVADIQAVCDDLIRFKAQMEHALTHFHQELTACGMELTDDWFHNLATYYPEECKIQLNYIKRDAEELINKIYWNLERL